MKKLTVIITMALLMSGYRTLSQDISIKSKYPHEIGNLRFSSKQVLLNSVKSTDSVTDTIKIYNAWSKPMNIAFATLPGYIKCKAVPATIKPLQQGYILFDYNAARRNDLGLMSDRVKIETNDSLQPEKAMMIIVNIMEDFSKMTPEQLANAAKFAIDSTTYDFGTIHQGDKFEHDFTFTNAGKSDLMIHSTRTSCGCTTSAAEKSVIKPGESSKIHVTFNSEGKSGKQNKSVTITCNDPKKPVLNLFLVGNIEAAANSGTKQ